MAEVTHLRIVFPLGHDYSRSLHTFIENGELHAAILHNNHYWRDNVSEPNYAVGMDVHIGVERPSDSDIWGNPMPVPAQGILRGECVRWDREYLPDGEPRYGGIGWLIIRLRYDMQEGPENWDLQKSGYTVYTTGQAPNFYFAAEKTDDPQANT